MASSHHNKLVQGLSSHMTAKIIAIYGHLFRDQVKPEVNDARLTQLIERVLNLNDRIKEEVVHAGDIHTEYFHYSTPYDGLRMTELDAVEGDPLPINMVSTCELDVRSTKAVGGGKAPESTILSKAIIPSEQVYD
ncbi:hypothetical protein FRC07_006424 [Ceratobasidium sp. 392]|nr:hypothetical protein FRC07_006424 [Ceratobasidium sp. 392]